MEFSQLVSIFGFDAVLEFVKSRSIKIKVRRKFDRRIRRHWGSCSKREITRVRFYLHTRCEPRRVSKQLPSEDSDEFKLEPQTANKAKAGAGGQNRQSGGNAPEIDSPELKAIRNFLVEASSNVPNVKLSCALELKERHGVNLELEQFSLIIHRPSHDLLKVETNIHRLLGLDEGPNPRCNQVRTT